MVITDTGYQWPMMVHDPTKNHSPLDETCRCGLGTGISALGRPGVGALGGAKARQARDLIDGTGGWVGFKLSQLINEAQHVEANSPRAA